MKARAVALGGVFAALAVVIMLLGGFIPVATFICPMLASALLAFLRRELPTAACIGWYVIVALLSALLYSAFYLAYVSFIAPDTFEQALSVLEDNPMMDSNSMSAIEDMIPKMPTISFFVNLIWCWLFGTVLAAIFSRNVASKNPFTDEQ